MKRIAALACILFAARNASTCLAQDTDVDWKYYGSANVSGDTVCFFDKQSVVYQSDKHIRVWTKCLPQKEVEGIDSKSDIGKRIVEATATKVAHYYMPPITKIQTLNSDQALTTTMYEQTANISYIQPQAQILYEFDCNEKKVRELSISIIVAGKHGSRDQPMEWAYIPPEGNAANLLRLLCTAK
jgi:hypothetical protein